MFVDLVSSCTESFCDHCVFAMCYAIHGHVLVYLYLSMIFFLYDETRNMRKRNKRKQDRNEIRCLLNAVRHSEHLKCMTCVMCLGFSGGGMNL